MSSGPNIGRTQKYQIKLVPRRRTPVDLSAFEVKRTLQVQWLNACVSARQQNAGQIAILSSLVARNATFLLALI